MKYGWKKPVEPVSPEHHYKLLMGVDEMNVKLPPHVDLRNSFMPEVYDQGQLGSCTANALCGAFEYDLRRQKLADFMPSRLFVYYNERLMEGDPDQDNGAQLSDGIKTLATQGVVREADWAYVTEKFAVPPPASAYAEALSNVTVQYNWIDNTNICEIKSCLAAGFPIAFGFTVFSAFESAMVAKTGILNLPTSEEDDLGGHAVVAVGYDDEEKRVIVRNSWGSAWGCGISQSSSTDSSSPGKGRGYFTMPYAYITNANLASDFWTIRLVK